MKYIFVALAFISCNGIQLKNTPDVSTEVLDTIKTTPLKIDAKPLRFEKAFILATKEKVNIHTVNFYGITIGKIKISSGRIIACDPMHIDEYGIPFTQVFPIGEFPVQLSIAKLDNEESIAFARIYFSDEPVESWQFALLKGQEPIPIGSQKKHGYSVDAGVGVFIDEAANKALDKNAVADMDGEVYKEINKHYHHDWGYAMYHFGDHNLAAFSSGFGDGYYATYIRFDAKGAPCRLLTDFNLLNWSQNNK